MEQGGSAVIVGANVRRRDRDQRPALGAITNASTASDIVNGVSILQTLQGTGTISTFGAAPALLIGSTTNSLTVGAVNPALNTILGPNATANPAGYGLRINGSAAASGVYDQLNYPNLLALVPATAIQVGGGGATRRSSTAASTTPARFRPNPTRRTPPGSTSWPAVRHP